jgi:hypothetical protein
VPSSLVIAERIDPTAAILDELRRDLTPLPLLKVERNQSGERHAHRTVVNGPAAQSERIPRIRVRAWAHNCGKLKLRLLGVIGRQGCHLLMSIRLSLFVSLRQRRSGEALCVIAVLWTLEHF